MVFYTAFKDRERRGGGGSLVELRWWSAVLGIRDIWYGSGSSPLTNGSGSNFGPDSFLQWLRMQKNFILFHIFFLPQALYLRSLIYCFKDFILQALFQSVQHLHWENLTSFLIVVTVRSGGHWPNYWACGGGLGRKRSSRGRCQVRTSYV
jgi:hypothetical protein